MSSGTLFVRFPDGTVRYGIYHGTCDIANDRLFVTSAEAWEARETGQQNWPNGRPELTEGVVPVRVGTNYGGGFTWDGHATLDTLVEGHQPYGDEWDGSGAKVMEDGEPDWFNARANEAVGSYLPITEGTE